MKYEGKLPTLNNNKLLCSSIVCTDCAVSLYARSMTNSTKNIHDHATLVKLNEDLNLNTRYNKSICSNILHHMLYEHKIKIWRSL